MNDSFDISPQRKVIRDYPVGVRSGKMNQPRVVWDRHGGSAKLYHIVFSLTDVLKASKWLTG